MRLNLKAGDEVLDLGCGICGELPISVECVVEKAPSLASRALLYLILSFQHLHESLFCFCIPFLLAFLLSPLSSLLSPLLGPARNINTFSGASVKGISINAGQVKIANERSIAEGHGEGVQAVQVRTTLSPLSFSTLFLSFSFSRSTSILLLL